MSEKKSKNPCTNTEGQIVYSPTLFSTETFRVDMRNPHAVTARTCHNGTDM